jgi:Immunoglobulin I-set domain
VAPKILPFTFGDQDYEVGMSAQVTCMVIEGDNPVDIRWNAAGHTHSSMTGITITKIGTRSSVLQIDSVDAGHSGNFTCTATNAAGSLNYSAQLTVVGP